MLLAPLGPIRPGSIPASTLHFLSKTRICPSKEECSFLPELPSDLFAARASITTEPEPFEAKLCFGKTSVLEP
uniref:Uncharacterized protein n=1 Tax=Arundo donax TaxID=35708 RepID=A0A0A9EU28_ARUDO